MHSVIKPLNLDRHMSFLLKHASGFKFPKNIICLQREFHGTLIQPLPDRLGLYRITCVSCYFLKFDTAFVKNNCSICTFPERKFIFAFNKTKFMEIAAQLMK